MTALDILPERIRNMALPLPEDIEELRLAVGQPVRIVTAAGETVPCPLETVTRGELRRITEAAAGGSLWSCETQMRRGFLSLPGGCRLGLCGSVNLERGEIRSFGEVSSLCLRFPREIKGCADGLTRLWEGGFASTLIVAPPGGGKTTLLRELVRVLSAGGTRVGLCDERGEVAALYFGVPQLDIGPRTDVLCGAPKAAAVMSLLRCMGPQVVALDEITEPEDVAACASCAGCGVKLLATAHGTDRRDLEQREVYRRLLERGIFSRCVTIRRGSGGGRTYEVMEL